MCHLILCACYVVGWFRKNMTRKAAWECDSVIYPQQSVWCRGLTINNGQPWTWTISDACFLWQNWQLKLLLTSYMYLFNTCTSVSENGSWTSISWSTLTGGSLAMFSVYWKSCQAINCLGSHHHWKGTWSLALLPTKETSSLIIPKGVGRLLMGIIITLFIISLKFTSWVQTLY